MKLYFATTSLNFNDILSTESLSPKKFYKLRTFGTRRYFSTELDLNENYITLFTAPPQFKLAYHQNSEYDEYPIIIEFDYQDNYSELIKLTEEIYIISRTIYIDIKKIKFRFFEEEHVKYIIAKSTLVEEVKLIQKYRKNFNIIKKDALKKIDTTNLDFPPVNKKAQDNWIEFDRIFDTIKGFLCAYLTKGFDINKSDSNSIFLEILNRLYKVISSEHDVYTKVIKKQLNLVEELHNEREEWQKKNQGTKINNILTSYKEKKITINSYLINDKTEIYFYELIINYFLNKVSNDTFILKQDEVINLLDYLKEEYNSREINNVYYSDCLKIYNRLINRNYDYNISDIESTVAKNLYAFLFKQDKIEELEEVLDSIDPEFRFIAYTFLGLKHGFSGISRVVVSSLFKDHNLMSKLNDELNFIQIQILRDLNLELKESYNYLSTNNLYASSLVAETHDIEDQLEIRLIEAIQKIRESRKIKKYLKKYKINLNEEKSIVFETIDKNVIVEFFEYDNIKYYICLKYKDNLNINEINNFKSNLKKFRPFLKISSIMQGNYPVFFYYKIIDDKHEVLDYRNVNDMLTELELIL